MHIIASHYPLRGWIEEENGSPESSSLHVKHFPLLNGGDRTSQAKVLSTTYRRGNRWKPGKPVCFLTTSIRHPNWMPELIGKLRAGTTTVGPDFCDGMKE